MIIVAEVGVNHAGSLNKLVETLQAAKRSGADLIKIQTYLPETMTINYRSSDFKYKKKYLWDLYTQAHIPRDWHKELFNLKLPLFSTPFSKLDVDFLEQFNPPCYKIASFEAMDLDFVDYVASTKKPVIVSLGCIHETKDIEAILETVGKHQDANKTILLHCISKYPTQLSEINIWRIPAIKKLFPNNPVGFSDHTNGIESAIIATVAGAEVLEKHFYVYGNCVDKKFSLSKVHFKRMVYAVKDTVKACNANLEPIAHAPKLGRSIFVVQNIKKGEVFTDENVKVIRPGLGAHPLNFKNVLGKKSALDVQRGTPFEMGFIDERQVSLS